MRAVDIIRGKRDGGRLNTAQIDAFVRGSVDGSWPPYQLSALLMAIVWRGMDAEETAHLTYAMAHSGEILDWTGVDGPKVDKHSSGGVGDKTSLIVVALASACGVKVPKMSGRGLGHTGGTLDKLESIPGYRIAWSPAEYRESLRTIGAALAGQTGSIAPADKVLYALRDVTATVESIPLITASILSKKLAEGLDALVLDVKCGRGAFMKELPEARALARSLLDTAQRNGLPTTIFITGMNQPLGYAIGNALEVRECIDVLGGHGPDDLTELSLKLAARMVCLARLTETDDEAEAMVRATLATGAGHAQFRRMVERHGGDVRVIDEPDRLPQAGTKLPYRAHREGFVSRIDAMMLGEMVMAMGGGREKVEDQIDHAVGVVLRRKIGDAVQAGDVIAEVHLNRDLPDWEDRLHDAIDISEEAPEPEPLILDRFG